MANNVQSLVAKIGVAVLVLVAAIWGVMYSIRPTVIVTPVIRGTAPKVVSGSVNVSAESQIELKSETGGRVIQSLIDPGRKFKKGELLAQIDPTDLQLDIEKAQSDYDAHKRRVEIGSSTKLELENAKDELANKMRLFKQGSLSESDLTRQQRAVKQLEQKVELEEVQNKATTETFENLLKVKRRTLEKMSITAPFDGVISAGTIRPGDLISIGSPIATLISNARTIEAKLSEENFASVQIGQKANVRFLTFGGEQYEAAVSKILPAADPTTQRYTVYLDVKLPEGRALAPGLSGEVTITVSEHPNTLIIPRRALVGNFVYVADGNKLSLRKVEKGYEGLKLVEITKGLAEKELVVVEEQDRLRDGDRVRTELLKEQ